MKKFFSLFFVLIFFFVSFSFAQTEKTVFSFESRLMGFKPFELKSFFVSASENFLIFNLFNEKEKDFVVLFDVKNNKLFRLNGKFGLPVVVGNKEFYALVQEKDNENKILLNSPGTDSPIELFSTSSVIVSNVYWSNNGDKLAFVSLYGKKSELIVLSNIVDVLKKNDATTLGLSRFEIPFTKNSEIVFSPDSRFVFFSYGSIDSRFGKLAYIDLETEKRFHSLSFGSIPIQGFGLSWSNDGKKIAFRKPFVEKNGSIIFEELVLLNLTFDDYGRIKGYYEKTVERISHSNTRLFFSSGDNELFYSAKNEIGYFGLKNNSKNSFLILDSKEMIADFVLQKNDRLFVIKSVLGKGLPELREVFSKQVFLQKKTPMIPTETTAVRKTQKPLASQQEIIPKIVSDISFSKILEVLNVKSEEEENVFGSKLLGAGGVLIQELSFSPMNDFLSFKVNESSGEDNSLGMAATFLLDLASKKLRKIDFDKKSSAVDIDPIEIRNYNIKSLSWKPIVDNDSVQWFAFIGASRRYDAKQIIISNTSGFERNEFEFFSVYSSQNAAPITHLQWIGNNIYFIENGSNGGELKKLFIPQEFFSTKDASVISVIRAEKVLQGEALQEEAIASFDISNKEDLMVYYALSFNPMTNRTSHDIFALDLKTNSKIMFPKKQSDYSFASSKLSADKKTIVFMSDELAYTVEKYKHSSAPLALAVAKILFNEKGELIGFSKYELIALDLKIDQDGYLFDFSNLFSNLIFYTTVPWKLDISTLKASKNPQTFFFYNTVSKKEKSIDFIGNVSANSFAFSSDGKKIAVSGSGTGNITIMTADLIERN